MARISNRDSGYRGRGQGPGGTIRLFTAEVVVAQDLDDLAGGNLTAGAFGGHARQLRPHHLQSGDLPRHVGQVSLGDSVDLPAWPVWMILQIEQGPDGVEIEPQLTGMADEG